MRNLIYQYWDGNVTASCRAGVAAMKIYADRIGADYLFEENPRFVTNLGGYSPHYGSFKPIFDASFDKYDNVLFCDTDIFPVDGLTESIFDNFVADVGICTEPLQPKLRKETPGRITSAHDERWASIIKGKWNADMPRNEDGLLKVYNSGVVMWSRKGRMKAKEKFVPFKEYVNLIKSTPGLIAFYTADQNYLHAMLTVAGMDYVDLNNGWNSYIHYIKEPKTNKKVPNDTRTKDTKFVHIQMAGADHYDAEKLNRITNLPKDEWNI